MKGGKVELAGLQGAKAQAFKAMLSLENSTRQESGNQRVSIWLNLNGDSGLRVNGLARSLV
jgi:hypothetical protein